RFAIEIERGRDIVVVDRPAERAPRERRDDPPGAFRFVSLALRLTNEDPLAARRVADPGRLVRPFDDPDLEPRQARRIVRLERLAERRLQNVLLLRPHL